MFQHELELIFIHENILKHDFYVLLMNVSIHSCIFVDSIYVHVHVSHTELTSLTDKSLLTVNSFDREFLKRSTTSLHFFPLSAPGMFEI